MLKGNSVEVFRQLLSTRIGLYMSDQEGVRSVYGDSFIDDSGVYPAGRNGSDNDGHSPWHNPQVILFLSKYDDDTTANTKLAKEFVNEWSRPVFNKSTRFEDIRRYDGERGLYRRPQIKK